MQSSLSKKELIILGIGLGLLILLVIINKRDPFFDEVLYLRDVTVLHQYGFSNQFLLKLTGSAGPLYAVVHYFFEPLTHLHQPLIRFVNVGFLLGVIFFVGKTLGLIGFSKPNYSFLALAIPMTYVTAGLALTEMPAMFFFSVGIYLTFRTVILEKKTKYQLLYLIMSGLCFGISITGRQPYLVIVAVLPVLFLDINWKDNIWKIVVLSIAALLLPAYIFWVWKDLVPPTDAVLYNDLAKAGSSFRLDFFFLCLAYFAVILFIIQPNFYQKPSSKTLGYFGLFWVILFALNFAFKWAIYVPFEGVFSVFYKSQEIKELTGIISGASLAFIAAYFLFTLGKHVINSNLQKYFLFYALGTVLVAFSCCKITWGFSSRYAAQAIPLLIPMAAYFRQSALHASNNFIIGIIIGLASLVSYLILGV